MRGLLLVHVQSQQSAACLAYHALPRRLARWLLATADRTGSLSFPLTQEYMAVMAGTRRTSRQCDGSRFQEAWSDQLFARQRHHTEPASTGERGVRVLPGGS